MLELRKRNIAELPFEVLEQAHWRPREAQLCCKYKPANQTDAEFRRLRRMWRSREVNFNFALDGALMSLNPLELGRFASELSGIEFDETNLVDGYCQSLKKLIGVPDFVLSDGTNAILGENKISAGYELNQFVKYQTFAALCQISDGLPSNLMNLILVQTIEPKHFLTDFGITWSPSIHHGELRLSKDDGDFVMNIVLENLSKIVKSMPEPRHSNLPEDGVSLTPTRVCTWENFFAIFDDTTCRPDLTTATKTLRDLGMGRVEISLSC